MATVLRERGYMAVAGSHWSWVGAGKPGEWLMVIEMQDGGKDFIGRDVWNDCCDCKLVELCKNKADALGLKKFS